MNADEMLQKERQSNIRLIERLKEEVNELRKQLNLPIKYKSKIQQDLEEDFHNMREL